MKHFKTTKKGKYLEENFRRQKAIKQLRKLKEDKKRALKEMREI